MRVSVKSIAALLTIFMFWGFSSFAETLSLDEYLTEVKKQNEGAKGLQTSLEAKTDYKDEPGAMYKPQFSLDWHKLEDKKPNPLFHSQGYNTQQTSFSISQMTNFGLQLKLSYLVDDIENVGIAPQYTEARPSLEVSKNLIRNIFGQETRAQYALLDASNKAALYQNRYNLNVVLMGAEVNYWQMALARETVSLKKAAVDRAEKIYDWMSRRAKSGLSDSGDMLQAKAAFQGRKLELKISEDEERAAARNFNFSRGKNEGETVKETLVSLDSKLFSSLDKPKSRGIKADTLASEEQVKVLQANAEMSYQKNLPTLDAYGSYGYNGVDNNYSTAVKDSMKPDQPTTLIGVRFSSSLAFIGHGQIREGWKKEILAAETSHRQLQLSEENQWNDLVARLGDAEQRLKNYTELEAIQKDKLEWERKRHSQGRTTLMNVLLYDIDLQQAQLGRLSTIAAVLQLHAQMKLFTEEK